MAVEEQPAQGERAGWWAIRATASKLKLGNVNQRREAAEVLGKSGNVSAIKPLLAALADEKLSVRRAVADALEQLHWPTDPWRQLLLALTTHQLHRAASVGSQAVGPLVEALDYRSRKVREQAIQRLGDVIEPAVAQTLIEILGSPAVRPAIVELLGELGGDEAVAPLIGALRDRDGLVRARAPRELLAGLATSVLYCH